MVLWAKLISAAVVSAGVGLGTAAWFGSARWNHRSSQLVEKFTGAIPRVEAETVDFGELERLPAPVSRYFRRVLKEGQPIIRSVRVTQRGGFRVRKANDGWNTFEATQHFSAGPPGFVWDAVIHMAPLMSVRVRDAYVGGRGSMQGKLLALVPVVDAHAGKELDAGTLQRYLAEAVWFPTALLPRAGVKWSAMDGDRASATLTDSGTTVSLEFRFNEAGEITEVFSPGRYREVNGEYELTPWAGRFRSYEERGGMLIPVEAEVEWRLRDGSFPYWKGRIVEVEYDFAR